MKGDDSGVSSFAGARRALRGAGNVLRTRYPLFLLGFPLPRREIPVFVYHDVEPQAFARELEFLRSNGYRTVSLDEFIVFGGRKSPGRERRILLGQRLPALLCELDVELRYHQA